MSYPPAYNPNLSHEENKKLQSVRSQNEANRISQMVQQQLAAVELKKSNTESIPISSTGHWQLDPTKFVASSSTSKDFRLPPYKANNVGTHTYPYSNFGKGGKLHKKKKNTKRRYKQKGGSKKKGSKKYSRTQRRH
jgi:hypothetical protein